ncbi:MAG: ribonuclease HI family protein [Chloroflexi bacterium]|nr:ribonuclease HI family protein [Chloroflexota bacterium]
MGPSTPNRTLFLYCDGAARGNPGPAGIGARIEDERGNIVREVSKFIGHATNNQAEYSALIAGLKAASELSPDVVHIRLDSELVVKQIKGEYRVRNIALKSFYDEATRLLRGFKKRTISHIPREQNRGADLLANLAIDGHV